MIKTIKKKTVEIEIQNLNLQLINKDEIIKNLKENQKEDLDFYKKSY